MDRRRASLYILRGATPSRLPTSSWNRKRHMDRRFDYAQRILLAVELADRPRRMEAMPASYACFKRLPIPAILRAFEAQHMPAQASAGGAFRNVLERSMGYWEERVPSGKQCFVHYAIGAPGAIAAAFGRLKADASAFALLGIYHVEPQSSAYPSSFPFGDTPDHWHPGEHFALNERSVFWFNFFPEQSYLFERTFACDDRKSLITHGVADFVQVNLNRFSSLPGFFDAAREAGEHTFTADPNYIWHGMLLSKA